MAVDEVLIPPSNDDLRIYESGGRWFTLVIRWASR